MHLMKQSGGKSISEGGSSTNAGTVMPKDFVTSVRFGFLIHDVSRLRRIVIDRALKPVGITRSQWWVLSFLGRRDGMTQTALAGDLDLTKVAVGGLLDRMESSGFIERRADQRDGRIKRVYLTSAGTKFLGTIRANIQQVEEEILADVDEAALQVTTETMLQIKRTLRAMSGADEGED
jgi:DNA-binding MarR family transcriptional regulator